MGIVSINTQLAGQANIVPRSVQLVTTDSLAIITAAGYLNDVSLQGYVLVDTDMVFCWYGYSTPSSPGTFAIFNPSITNGVITLVEWTNPGNVLLPVVSGDVAVFNGTAGQIKDSGAALSNAADPYVASSAGSLTSGNLMKLADANGSIGDQGVAMKSVAQAAVAGGNAAQTVTDTFCTAGACVIASWNDTTNACEIETVAAGAGSFIVTSTADPGASHLNYVIFK